MLRHPTAIILRHSRLTHIKQLSSQAETKTIVEETKSVIKASQDRLQDRIMLLSNSALSRYNEIIGFSEIDKEYKKVTELQVGNFADRSFFNF